ncbi:type II secretion system F family protein [Jannaschia seohaensis]|uniref:Tight adherence protein C n=1 Tax=Jannaschia seohaensis TaxID=475081 RepID=A0A2Y9AJW4_9RHOB|nr:type II secretion system F family protein [Jannaschia seohaensis]PWJ20300.1 tight adherence protein C [Jannaschia seohaensis]SSA44326.1 tight adherence protein C [Jannaschia seohaensis]
MDEIFELFSQNTGLDPQIMVFAAIGLGAGLAFYGIVSAVTQVDPGTARLLQTRDARRQRREDKGLLLERVETSKGVLRTFVPKNPGELTKLKIKLIQAGYRRESAVRFYVLARIALGLGLPLAFVALLGVAALPNTILPPGVNARLAGLGQTEILAMLGMLTFVGFLLPARHVEGRALETRTRIMESFPNALDLLQISVEAGLGLDAAMTRVGNELAAVCPELSAEFLTVQRQIQAGRPRDVAMREMAARCGVDTVSSFVKVVQQSLQFGTPLTEALHVYASEMRLYRELAAQEMANKLPVKMSIALASFMLPALILMTVGPTVIRWLTYTG